jgi:hypothetical protein
MELFDGGEILGGHSNARFSDLIWLLGCDEGHRWLYCILHHHLWNLMLFIG